MNIRIRGEILPRELRGLDFDISDSELKQSYAERKLQTPHPAADSVRLEFARDSEGEPEWHTLQFIKNGELVGSLDRKSGQYMTYRGASWR